jgi:ATP-dependent Clp protease ATP-binding subunit ClpC
MASDKQKLLTLEEDLMKGVIGQDQACKAIANAVRRNSAGINNPNKPIASFLFAGKSGVGKTEAAKVLADLRFGSRDNIIRIDCSEYSEEHAVSKLIGSNPGYVGYNEGGVLTEAIKNKPYAIVLFDEIEKAHSKFTEILLQVLDEGRLTDNTGTTISFKNTIIIMTTNMGSSLLDKANSVGFGSKDKQVQEESAYEKLKDVTMESIKKQLRPEVINRIDDIIVFHSLNKEDLRQITRLLGKQLDKRLAVLNITATCSEEALDFIADNGGYNEAYGARPLAKAIVKHIEEPLSIMILQDEIMPGQSVWIDLEDGKLTFKVIDNTMEAVSE